MHGIGRLVAGANFLALLFTVDEYAAGYRLQCKIIGCLRLLHLYADAAIHGFRMRVSKQFSRKRKRTVDRFAMRLGLRTAFRKGNLDGCYNRYTLSRNGF